jgi:putative OPT family oligopeptide transporter
MGLAALWEVFVNPRGIQLVRDSAERFFGFGSSQVEILGQSKSFAGGMRLQTPGALPALFGVGFIVGPQVSAVLFAGALFGHLFLAPLALFLQPELAAELGAGASLMDLSKEVYGAQVKPLAVGAMIVAAFYTLYSLRKQLVSGMRKGFAEIGSGRGDGVEADRLSRDISLKKVGLGIIVMAVALFFLYKYFTGSIGGSLVLTVVMVVLGFLFAAVAGYLVGLIGSSNNPISGLTLSTLIIAALLMVMLKVSGGAGIAGVLAVAGVVCCSCGIAGDMMQDLKVGHVLGGTPWRMQIGEIIGVIPAALVLPWVLYALHRTYVIGSEQLAAPQAGLMALMAKGIVGGEMAWPLVIAGMFLAVGLILIRAPAPMLIAVGMYLPFYAVAGIFVGGIFRWIMDTVLSRRQADAEATLRAENTGVLLSSGFIAGGALTAVVIAFVVLGYSVLGTPLKEDPAFRQMAIEAGVAADDEPAMEAYLTGLADEYGVKAEDVPTFMDRLRRAIGFEPTAWLGLIAFIGGGLLLTVLPIRASRDTS